MFIRDKRKKRSKKIDWDEYYARKLDDDFSLSEKHFLYYLAFKPLGFFDNLNKNSKVLQLGLGHGKTLRQIIKEELDIVPFGLDISLLALLNVRERTNMKNLICADALNLPFSDNSFSRVFEVGVVEHFYEDDPFKGAVVDRELIIESLKEIRRILYDGGKVAFIQPSKHSVLPISQKIDEIVGKWEFGFQENFSINDFSQIVSIAGFRNIKYCILQAPDDFPLRIRVGDRLLKTFYALTGQYRKGELTGALFCLIAEK